MRSFLLAAAAAIPMIFVAGAMNEVSAQARPEPGVCHSICTAKAVCHVGRAKKACKRDRRVCRRECRANGGYLPERFKANAR